jgi:hypothetical protein
MLRPFCHLLRACSCAPKTRSTMRKMRSSDLANSWICSLQYPQTSARSTTLIGASFAPRMEQAASQIQDSSDLLDFSSMAQPDGDSQDSADLTVSELGLHHNPPFAVLTSCQCPR